MFPGERGREEGMNKSDGERPSRLQNSLESLIYQEAIAGRNLLFIAGKHHCRDGPV